jgi:hypothetical protein
VLCRLFLHTKRKALAAENEIRFRNQLPVSVCSEAAKCPLWSSVILERLDWIEEVVSLFSPKDPIDVIWRGRLHQQCLQTDRKLLFDTPWFIGAFYVLRSTNPLIAA